MFAQFLKHKLKGIGSILKIVGSKFAREKGQQIQGMKSALEPSNELRQDYLEEKQPEAGQIKVLKQSGGQDISAI